jgi:tRNA 2-thiouridine synthesizing protein E
MNRIDEQMKEATCVVAERTVAGQTIAVDAEGFMVDSRAWNEAIAAALAAEIGIALTPRHWQVIHFSRQEFEANGQPPTLRRITTAGGVPTKELYELFPKKPAKKVAFIAGLPKPSGCI